MKWEGSGEPKERKMGGGGKENGRARAERPGQIG
jgi:hypothetical protein